MDRSSRWRMSHIASTLLIWTLILTAQGSETAVAGPPNESALMPKPGGFCPLGKQLSWKSISRDDIAYMFVYPEGEIAEALWRMGPRASACLVSVLEDPDRGVAAHVILTHIYHRDRIVPRVRTIRLKDSRGFVIQTVNGLSWRYDPWRKTYSVKPRELHQNALRWRQELKM